MKKDSSLFRHLLHYYTLYLKGKSSATASVEKHSKTFNHLSWLVK